MRRVGRIQAFRGIVEQGDGEVDSVLTGTAEDLVLALTGEANLGVLLRSGGRRHVVADEDQAARRDLMRELALIVETIRGGSGAPVRDTEHGSVVA